MELGPPLHSSSRPLESSPNYPSPSRSSLEAQRTPLYKAFMTRLGDSLSPSQRLRETLAQSSSLPSTSLRVIQTPSADGIWSGSVFLPQNSKAPYIPQAPKDDQVFLGRNFRLSLLASDAAQIPGPGSYTPSLEFTRKNPLSPKIPLYEASRSHGVIFSRTPRFTDNTPAVKRTPPRPRSACVSPAASAGQSPIARSAMPAATASMTMSSPGSARSQRARQGRPMRRYNLFGLELTDDPTPGPGDYDPIITAVSTPPRR